MNSDLRANVYSPMTSDFFSNSVPSTGELALEDRVALRRVAGLSTELADVSEVEYRQLRLERVVLVGVPGAFTPSCHRNHLPGFVANKDALLARGIDAIAVTSVNDVFVLDAWSKASGAEGLEFLADGNGDFAKGLGLEMDGSGFGLGLRSKRYAMLVEDGVVRVLNIEESPSKADISSAEALLKVI